MKIFRFCFFILMFAQTAFAQPDLEARIRKQAEIQIKAQSEISQRNNSPLFVATINPLYQILLAITEDKNNSILLFNPYKSEHGYELAKDDLATLSRARVIFYMDDNLEKNFAKLVKNFSLGSRSYQMARVPGLKLLRQRGNAQKIDYHLWLDPQNAIKIADFISQRLCEVDGINCAKYRNNYQKFSLNVNAVAADLNNQLERYRNLGFVFYHDAYQYFEDYFNLRSLMVLSYEGEPAMSISALRQFDKLAKAKSVRCVFGEVLDETNSAEKLARKYQINYMPINAIGLNGESYSDMLTSLVGDFNDCLFY